MDSRLIYSASNSLMQFVDWVKQTESEWIYIGIEDEVKSEIVHQTINNVFSDTVFYIALTRTNSTKISKNEIESQVIKRIGKDDFLLVNLAFDKMLEFNKIGVLRIGIKKLPRDKI